MVGGDQNAQDIVEEAYAHALKGFSRFPGDNPRAWLLAIVRSTAYSWIKKKQRYEDKAGTLDEEVCYPVGSGSGGAVSWKPARDIRKGLEPVAGRVPRGFSSVWDRELVL